MIIPLSLKQLEEIGKHCLEAVGLSYDINIKGNKIVYVVQETGIDSKVIKITPTKKRKPTLKPGIESKARKLFKNKSDAYYLYILLEKVKSYINKIDFSALTPEQKSLLILSMPKDALEIIPLKEGK